jgi:hypothetical protein
MWLATFVGEALTARIDTGAGCFQRATLVPPVKTTEIVAFTDAALARVIIAPDAEVRGATIARLGTIA